MTEEIPQICAMCENLLDTNRSEHLELQASPWITSGRDKYYKVLSVEICWECASFIQRLVIGRTPDE